MNYADRAKAARAKASFKLETGTYTAILQNWDYKLSANDNPMFILKWRPLDAPSSQTFKYLQRKNKTLDTRYCMHVDWHVGDLLILFEDSGIDLSKIEEATFENRFRPFKDLIDYTLMDIAPKVELYVSEQSEKGKYGQTQYNIKVSSVLETSKKNKESTPVSTQATNVVEPPTTEEEDDDLPF